MQAITIFIFLVIVACVLAIQIHQHRAIHALQEHVHYLHVELGILIDAPNPASVP